MNFKDSQAIKNALKTGKVQLIRPDADAVQREMGFINEVRSLWEARKNYAEQLVATDGYSLVDSAERPDQDKIAKLFDLADALAREQQRRAVEESMQVLVYLERPIPEQLAFLARLLDLEVPKAPESNVRAVLSGPAEGSA